MRLRDLHRLPVEHNPVGIYTATHILQGKYHDYVLASLQNPFEFADIVGRSFGAHESWKNRVPSGNFQLSPAVSRIPGIA